MTVDDMFAILDQHVDVETECDIIIIIIIIIIY